MSAANASISSTSRLGTRDAAGGLTQFISTGHVIPPTGCRFLRRQRLIDEHREATVIDRLNIPPPLCVYCSSPWTDEMMKIQVDADFRDGYYAGDNAKTTFDATVDVVCSTCGRLVYRKEVRDLHWYGG